MVFADNILKMVGKFYSLAFAPNPDLELESPNVIIQPMEGLVQQAVERIKQMEPGYFKGIRSIVIGPQSHYGFVELGPEKDPSVIHLNYNRIRQEISAQGGSDEDVIKSLIDTITHEAGHVRSFDPQQGFVGGEQPAEQETIRMQGLMPRAAKNWRIQHLSKLAGDVIEFPVWKTMKEPEKEIGAPPDKKSILLEDFNDPDPANLTDNSQKLFRTMVLFDEGFYGDNEIIPVLLSKFAHMFSSDEKYKMETAQKQVDILYEKLNRGPTIAALKQILDSDAHPRIKEKVKHQLYARRQFINEIEHIVIDALPEKIVSMLSFASNNVTDFEKRAQTMQMPQGKIQAMAPAKIQAARTAINILSGKLPDDISYADVMRAYAALRNGGWKKGELPDLMKALAIWYSNRKGAVNYLLLTSHQGLPIERQIPGGGGQGVVNDLKRIIGG